MNLEQIIVELNKPGRSDHETIRTVLYLGHRRVQLKFLLRVCESVEHLMTDEWSRAVIPELKRCLEAGGTFKKSVAKAAFAAAYYVPHTAASQAARAAAHAAAHFTADGYAAANYTAGDAAAFAAHATADTYVTAYAAAEDPEGNHVYQETLRAYLLTLKELILESVPPRKRSWLLETLL